MAETAAVFSCAGVRIRSSLELAAPRVGGDHDVEITEGEARPIPFQRPSADVVAERIVQGVPWYTFARVGEVVVARFYGLADFEIDERRRVVVYHRAPETDPGLVAILIAGSLVAYLLSVGGHLVLHASAVDVDGMALAFIGYSGQGKTTIAAVLCAAGFPLVTDDLLPIDVGTVALPAVTCVPGGVELRLRGKAETLLPRFDDDVVRRVTVDQRYAVTPAATKAPRLPLRAIAIPRPDPGAVSVVARLVPPGQASVSLARYQRIEGWTSPADLRAQFDLVSRVAGSVPVVDLRVPWGPPFPADLARAIVAAVVESDPKCEGPLVWR